MNVVNKKVPQVTARGSVYCYMCTHTVEADVISGRRNLMVKPGQKCPRCAAPLDSGYVLRVAQAA